MSFLHVFTLNLHPYLQFTLLSKAFFAQKKIAKVIKTLAIQSTINTFPEALQVLVLLYQF